MPAQSGRSEMGGVARHLQISRVEAVEMVRVLLQNTRHESRLSPDARLSDELRLAIQACSLTLFVPHLGQKRLL